MDALTLCDSSGNPVECVVSIPRTAKSVAILSHGFSSGKRSGFYRELEDLLNEANIGTVRYDYYGHGPAYGHPGPGYGVCADVTLSKAVGSLKAVAGHVKSIGEYRLGLLGSSFGGCVSLVGAIVLDNVRALALRSPVAEPKSFWRERLGEDGLEAWRKKGRIHYAAGDEDYDLDYAFWEDLQPYDTLGLARNIACPSLIVHGDQDSCVPLGQSIALAKAMTGRLRVVQGADHAYSTPAHYSTMKRLMADFLVKNLRADS